MSWHDVFSSVRGRLRRNGRDTARREAGESKALGPHLEQLGHGRLAMAPTDVYENGAELLIRADVPGGTPEGTTVNWDPARGLTFLVKAGEQPSGSRQATEYEPRDWYRAIELPSYVDPSQATSLLRDGVLTIRVPKRAATSRIVPVKAG